MLQSNSTSPRASSSRKAVMLGVLLSATALLGGCSNTLVATVEPVCDQAVLADVCVSRADVITEPTAKQIEGNNLALRRICKRQPTCPAAKSGKSVAVADAQKKIAP